MNTMLSGSEILIRSLLYHHVNTIFGYPGSCVMSILDCLYDYKGTLDHVLVRHEQGAIHAAQGYAQASKRVGVAMVTSGPAATNIVTGLADAMADSTPLVVITGQVYSHLLGSDAFQEVDVIGITHSTTKWVCQIRSANEIASAVAHAFYIASSGRSGPVVLDITKDAQVDKAVYSDQKINFIRGYSPNLYIEPWVNVDALFSSQKDKNKADHIIDILQNIEEDLILVLDIEHQVELVSDQQKVVKSTNFRTKGFGLPAAIGAKYASPNQTVCLVVGVEEFQATIQELGVIIQASIDIKIFLVNNCEQTPFEVLHPDFVQIAHAYNIEAKTIFDSGNLLEEIHKVVNTKETYLLEIK